MASPSSPKTLATQVAIQLTDPNHVTEVFANTVAGIRVQDGLAYLTYGVLRARHANADPNADQEHVVALRLVVPLAVMGATFSGLQQIEMAQQAQKNLKPN